MELWGKSTAIDLVKCDPKKIRDQIVIIDFVVKLCDLIGMKRFGGCNIVNFGDDEKVAGYSMTQLIETSLISGHFVNISNHAYIDIFSCSEYDSEKAAHFSQAFFCAEKVLFHIVNRYSYAHEKII